MRKLLIVVAALVAATGGTATAAKLITGKDIRNGSVTGKDIKNKSLGVSDLSKKARASLRGQTGATGASGLPGATGPVGAAGGKGDTGPTGPQGEKGEKGDKGDQGEQGIQGEAGPSKVYRHRSEPGLQIDDANDNRRLYKSLGTLPAGKYVFTAKLVATNFFADPRTIRCDVGTLIGVEEYMDAVDYAVVRIPGGQIGSVITLTGAVSLEAPRRVAIDCSTFGDTYHFIVASRSFTAQLVGDIVEI